MKTIIFLLLTTVVALGIAGCGIVPQVQYKFEDGDSLSDGTKPAPGALAYVDAEGHATDKAVDPVTGKPNDPLMVGDDAAATKAAAGVAKVAENIPGLGWLVAGGIGLLGAGVAGGIRLANRKKLQDAGVSKAPAKEPVVAT